MKATKSCIGSDVAGETCKEQLDEQATLPLLQSDPKLFCVSAWNDNGRPDLVQNATAIYRSEAFSKMKWPEKMYWTCQVVMIHALRTLDHGCVELLAIFDLLLLPCNMWRSSPLQVAIWVATPAPRISFLVSVGCCWAASGMKSRANGPTRSLAERNVHTTARPICSISAARRQLSLRYWDDFLRRSDIRHLVWDRDGHDITGGVHFTNRCLPKIGNNRGTQKLVASWLPYESYVMILYDICWHGPWSMSAKAWNGIACGLKSAARCLAVDLADTGDEGDAKLEDKVL